MALDYTTTRLLALIEELGAMPLDQSTFPPVTVLRMADTQLELAIVPVILSTRAAHFRTSVDYVTTEAAVYPIPEYAMNRSLQNVAYVSPTGEESALTPVDHDREMEEGVSWYSWATGFLGGRQGYYVSGDDLVLFPAPAAGKTLRVYYYRRPNRLVEENDAARVISVNPGTGVVTCATVPGAWAIGTSLCCVAGKPGFALRFEARAITGVASPTVTLGDVTGIVAGDYLALEGDSPIPQLPVEAHALLAQKTVCKILESLGDAKKGASDAEYTEMLRNYVNSFPLRVEQAPKRIAPRKNLLRFMG